MVHLPRLVILNVPHHVTQLARSACTLSIRFEPFPIALVCEPNLAATQQPGKQLNILNHQQDIAPVPKRWHHA